MTCNLPFMAPICTADAVLFNSKFILVVRSSHSPRPPNTTLWHEKESVLPHRDE